MPNPVERPAAMYAGNWEAYWQHKAVEAEQQVLTLRAALAGINEAIYAQGAPIGSDTYFRVRELCTQKL